MGRKNQARNSKAQRIALFDIIWVINQLSHFLLNVKAMGSKGKDAFEEPLTVTHLKTS